MCVTSYHFQWRVFICTEWVTRSRRFLSWCFELYPEASYDLMKSPVTILSKVVVQGPNVTIASEDLSLR